MKTKFIRVSVEERLPEVEKHVLGIWNTGESGTVVINENGYWYSFEAQSECDQPDFWLEEVPDREDEMREMLEECRIQLQYLNEKQERGTTNSVLNRLIILLNK